ncbi:MAG: 3-dehydroquinate synthase [Bacteroidia bacterium]
MKQGLSQLQKFIAATKEDIIVLADKHTLKDCYPLLEADLPHFIVPYGEGYKNLDSCEFIWKKLIDLGATRKTTLLCLGGGVLCDMGSFAGGCFQRGMKVVLVPTSLLAMVDASVGGKNGVNFFGLKNYIGNFKEADETFICPEFLKTLPQKEFTNGYVEMLKHGLIADKEHYDEVKMSFLQDRYVISEITIMKSIGIKKRHVEQDFRDNGVRKRLNFGHTIGHAIESHSLAISDENKELSHGISVALGIIAECYISNKLLNFSKESLDEISVVFQKVISTLGQDIPDFSDLWPYLQHDKKNLGVGVNFSLLTNIGEAVHDQVVEKDLIEESVGFLRSLR